MCAHTGVKSVICICFIGTFARAPIGQLCLQRRQSNISLLGHMNVVSHVLQCTLLSYNLDLSADLFVNKYKFIIFKSDGVCQFFPRVQVDVSKCYDVMNRYRHRLALLSVPMTWCASASASDEDDSAGESRFTRFHCL